MKRRQIDSTLEQKIITGMVVSSEFLKGIIQAYKPAYLETSFARIVAGWCLDFYKKYGKAPGREVQNIFQDWSRNNKDTAEIDLIAEFLDNLSKQYEGMPEDERKEQFEGQFLLDRAVDHFERHRLKMLAEDMSAHLSNGDLAEAQKLISEHRPIIRQAKRGQGFSAKELMEMEVPEIRWCIEEVIPEGLTLLAGKPKTGKSFFLLDAAIALASGTEAFGRVATEAADVLYLALEDPTARLRDRLNKMLRDSPAPDRLHLYPSGQWAKAHEGGMAALEEWMEEHPKTRLVVIDTLERFKKPQKAPGYHYTEDYASLSALQEFAAKHHIGVVVVHHTRKGAAADPFDEISGTTGLTAAADTLATLSRAATGKEGRVFALRGRDVGEDEMPFRFADFRYQLAEGEVEQFQGSESRQSIVRYLRRADAPVARKALIEVMEEWKVGKGVDTLLQKMVANGDVIKVGYGEYAHKAFDDSHITWIPEVDNRISLKLNFGRKKSA